MTLFCPKNIDHKNSSSLWIEQFLYQRTKTCLENLLIYSLKVSRDLIV